MAQDNAPIKHTCPIIDSIIAEMESAKGEAEYILKNKNEDSEIEARAIIVALESAIGIIEDVRTANSTLREWGNDEYERAEEAEKREAEALREIEDLKDRILELKDNIEELSEKAYAI
jgi:ElaB/YqjD/DUF883 family membrane-anchored ribosome-binding protein